MVADREDDREADKEDARVIDREEGREAHREDVRGLTGNMMEADREDDREDDRETNRLTASRYTSLGAHSMTPKQGPQVKV